MTNRTPLLIAANWKMNEPPVGSYAPDSPYRSTSDVDVWVFPPLIDWHGAHAAGLVYGAQCGRPEPEGAFTGDISMRMLKNQRFHAVLCGHSDRRAFHGETDEDVARQVIAALEAEMTPILCIGETAEQRSSGQSEAVVRRQLETSLSPLITHNSQLSTLNSQLIIAYEPIWAISRGDPSTPAATPKDAQQMHAFIRKTLSTLHSPLSTLRLLYGGSMNASNAAALLAQPDIDGGLVGGASLKPNEFKLIVEAAT
jgi:triosephosphate isomerase (TIM)